MLTPQDAFTALQATYPPLADDAPLLVAIEDDAAAIMALRQNALSVGCAITVIPDLAEAEATLLALLQSTVSRRTVLLLVDQQLPFEGVMTQIDGWTLIGRVMQAILDGALAPVLMVAISADMTPDRHENAIHSGAYAALEKPFTDHDLRDLLAIAGDGQTAQQVVSQYQQRDAVLSPQRTITRSMGARMLEGLKAITQAMTGGLRAVETITSDQMAILLCLFHHDWIVTAQVFGSQRAVRLHLEQAVAHTILAAPDPQIWRIIIQSLQEGWSQQRLGEQLHMSRTTAWRYRQIVLQALCTAFCTSPASGAD